MEAPSQSPVVRLQSLDVFRGLVILAMILVNTLGDLGFANVPAFLEHTADGIDGISFADLIFPAFIFMMGMSIPFAMSRQKDSGASLLFLVTKENTAALVGAIGFGIALYIGSRHGALHFVPEGITRFIGIGEIFGSNASIAVAGVLAAVFLRRAEGTGLRAHLPILTLGLMLLFAGELIRPLHGASKNAGTDAYCLISSGISCLFFLFLHIAFNYIPVLHKLTEAIAIIGKNPMLGYFLLPACTYTAVLLNVDGIIWFTRESPGLAACLNVCIVMIPLFAVIYVVTKKGFVVKL